MFTAKASAVPSSVAGYLSSAIVCYGRRAAEDGCQPPSLKLWWSRRLPALLHGTSWRDRQEARSIIFFMFSDYKRFRNAGDTGKHKTLFPIANPNEYGSSMAISLCMMCTNGCQVILFAVARMLCGYLRQAGVPQTEQK